MWLSKHLTKQQLRALHLIHEDIELEREDKLQTLHDIVGDESIKAIFNTRKATGWEDLEKRMKWPARSGRVAIRILCDFLISIQSERDTRIF